MLKQLMNDLKVKHLVVNDLVDSIHEELSELKYDFNPLVRYDTGYGDFSLFLNLNYYNRELSVFRITINEETDMYKIYRLDKNLSDYNTNGDYKPIKKQVDNFENDLKRILNIE